MYQPISSLELPDYKVQELRTLGYHYCKDVKTSDDDSKSKLSQSEWDEFTNVPKTKSALDIYQEECVSGSILTFSKELDGALGGGIPVGLITEFCGEPGCGKTQLCFQLSVNVQLPVWCGGMAGEAVYISTNKGFASHRLKEMASALANHYTSIKSGFFSEELTTESIMQKIHYISADNAVELIAVVKYMEKWLENHPNVRLVIVDSITAPFKLMPAQERTPVIYTLFKDLQELARQHRFAIVLTNDITTRIGAANTVYHTPALGGSYYHRINVRVQLSKKSENVFSAAVVKSVLQPPSEVEFSLFS